MCFVLAFFFFFNQLAEPQIFPDKSYLMSALWFSDVNNNNKIKNQSGKKQY